MVVLPPVTLAETSSPVEVRFGTSRPQRRATVVFRWILVLPQVVVVYFVGIGALVVTVLGWFAALVTGRLPVSFAEFLLGYVRWSTRVSAYSYLLTDGYPPFSLQPAPAYPVDVTARTGRLNRLAVLFRFVLVIPAALVSYLFVAGMGIFAIVTWIATLVVGQVPDTMFGANAAALRFQARVGGYFLMVTSYYPSAVLGDGIAEPTAGAPAVSGTALAPTGVAAWSAEPGGGYVPPPPPPGYPPAPPPPPGYPPAPPPPPPAPTAAYRQPTAPPRAVPEAAPPGAPSLWPLLLTKAARTLAVVFLVLGLVGGIAYQAVLASAGSSVNTALAQTEVTDAFGTVSRAAQAFGTSINGCGSNPATASAPLPCLQQATTTFAGALQAYARQLAAISYPASATSEADAAQAAATRAAAALADLAAVSDPQTFMSRLTSSSTRDTVNAVETTSQSLHNALAAA